MKALVTQLELEHRNLDKLAGLLSRFRPSLSELPPDQAEIQLLVDVLSYLTQFPDVHHHPVEDRIVEALRNKGALDNGLSEEIERQHRVLAQQGQDLMRDLESAAREETVSWVQLPIEIRLYAERLRHNMVVEELALFPLAVTRLGDADAQAIGMLLSQAPPDPLFVDKAMARFADLHRIIATEAGCGCFDHLPPAGAGEEPA
ncbi:MAG TPA: hemerythrin domain-containing protein [Noviherbaspirillum sp.]|uniref:hemerythrin domain-containing protein n=1 Tax=Noviherbaspirillum sp. TaxID=1926288 RepID=UPI002B46BCDB|nr:hemerythrin domain-containing protein [Noviherbaspirillum sp.]HJV87539.1 hemerythrin domain-containing protein [Noviherbaspirillum sp.]